MKMVYIVQGQSTGINGDAIHWVDSVYSDEGEAIKQCDTMNNVVKNDLNYMVYVVKPMPLIQEKNQMKFMRGFSKWFIWSMTYISFMKVAELWNLPNWAKFVLFLLACTAYIFWLAPEDD